METLEKKVFSYIREHQMLLPGERVVAGISGGADSVCLLFVLLEWKRQFGLEPIVVHINHGIRREAAEDAEFVRELCERHEVPFYLRETDIPKLAEESKCSEEEAGRNFRYQAFAEIAKQTNATRIAVAHNLNDRGETLLFHLFRGSGLKGLTGIAPVREQIIRPLLCVERREIEEYLEQKGQNFCHDCTNDGDDYTRNRIRHHILDYAQREIVPGCVQRMGQTADILTETEDYLEQQTQEALKACIYKDTIAEDVVDKGGMESEKGHQVILDCEKVLSLHTAIRKRVLLAAICKLSPYIRDISYVHVKMLEELFSQKTCRQFDLPHGIVAQREYEKVILRKSVVAEEVENPLVGLKVEFQVLPMEELPGKWNASESENMEKTLIFPQNQYTKWFDYDKIEKSPVMRTRQTGDYLTIRDSQGRICRKKLKDYMIESKIPAAIRDKIPLLAVDSHIIWIMGYRISEYYKVCGNTKQVLQVQLISGIDDTEENL